MRRREFLGTVAAGMAVGALPGTCLAGRPKVDIQRFARLAKNARASLTRILQRDGAGMTREQFRNEAEALFLDLPDVEVEVFRRDWDDYQRDLGSLLDGKRFLDASYGFAAAYHGRVAIFGWCFMSNGQFVGPTTRLGVQAGRPHDEQSEWDRVCRETGLTTRQDCEN